MCTPNPRVTRSQPGLSTQLVWASSISVTYSHFDGVPQLECKLHQVGVFLFAVETRTPGGVAGTSWLFVQPQGHRKTAHWGEDFGFPGTLPVLTSDLGYVCHRFICSVIFVGGGVVCLGFNSM